MAVTEDDKKDSNYAYQRVLEIGYSIVRKSVKRRHTPGCLVELGDSCDCGHDKINNRGAF